MDLSGADGVADLRDERLDDDQQHLRAGVRAPTIQLCAHHSACAASHTGRRMPERLSRLAHAIEGS